MAVLLRINVEGDNSKPGGMMPPLVERLTMTSAKEAYLA
jgi:hypothetical protein